MVSLGLHEPWTVLPLAALITSAGWHVLAPPAAVHRATVMGAALLLAGVLLWAVVNVAMASEYLIVLRDPGFLTLSGMWLVDHPHTDIPALGAIQAAQLQANMLADASQAWNVRGDMVQPQGAKMLPATLAIGGWVAGDTGVLAANVVIGAVVIIAMYVLAHRFLGPLAALVPAFVLGLTVAHIGLSRSGYSEPLTALLVLAGVAWGWRGVTDHRLGPLIAAAIASGATTFIRIDGASFAVGALAGVVVALALSAHDAAWRTRAALAFTGVQALTLAAGYASLWRWSEEYMVRLFSEFQSLATVYGAGALVLTAWVLTWHVRGRRGLAADWMRTTVNSVGHRGAVLAAGAVIAMLAVLASRPWWTTVRRGDDTSHKRFTNEVVESFQRLQGLPIDPQRTYAEHTVTWLSYYLTWPLVVLGIIGFGLITYRMLRGDRGWAVFLGAILAPTLLYLWRPAIVPDQLWAIRRFEPATLPGFALAAAVAAWWLLGMLRSRWNRAEAARVVAAAMIMAPVTGWLSIVPDDRFPLGTATPVTSREMAGARDQLTDLCAVIDGRPVVLWGDSSHFGSIRVMCDVPVVLALEEPTPQTLLGMADVWGEAPVVLTRKRHSITWTTLPQRPSVESEVVHANYSLQRIPRSYIQRSYEWYAGLVTDTGELEPLYPTTASAES